MKYFHFQHIITRGWIFYKDGTWVSAISIIMIEGQVLLSLYTSLITGQLGRHNVFNTSPCCQYVFTNSPRRRQWSSWCCQWSSVHRQEVVSDRQRSWPSCQQIVICTFMCCHWGVNTSSIRRQANHLAMYWRCTGDFWWISSREDGASASPDVASWCERGLHSDQANSFMGIQWRLGPANSRFGAKHRNHYAKIGKKNTSMLFIIIAEDNVKILNSMKSAIGFTELKFFSEISVHQFDLDASKVM